MPPRKSSTLICRNFKEFIMIKLIHYSSIHLSNSMSGEDEKIRTRKAIHRIGQTLILRIRLRGNFIVLLMLGSSRRYRILQ